MSDLTNQRPHPVTGYMVEEMDGEILLFHPSQENIFYTNNTGSLIWQLCDGQRTVAEICQLLSDAYPDAASQIEQDVHNTLSDFATHGAIEWNN